MKETFNLIEEITRLDGSIYYELGNIPHNGRAEYAAEHGYIKSVRILKINIPRSSYVEQLENYINANYQLLPLEYDGWEEWQRTPEMAEAMTQILLENKLG
ncbi:MULTISPECIES: hypothetical protein [Leuconostoc]|jgi:hypothetical protein|uniref:Uncharacterized protein n=2 Tax=Leuconostoc citreum TaxID=33964 RepID=B1MXC2_LEUCK|nr:MULTISPECIES: hypothetical protein [Leuconostoc]ETI99608.1 MAG: hypothetical protein Q611_LSC00257G0002 [Leuconostoc sp. DORA_2]ACA82174.1 Protein of unknown function [Leuconostoc citreum KM20]KAF0260309.1 hypothetical protein CRI81_07625 [Leuconostoc citreum]MBA5938641.1 hypothetical protein [Leuconostoc citreum]MBE4726463.1 hypothetical protein [Leuconostoc citreum]